MEPNLTISLDLVEIGKPKIDADADRPQPLRAGMEPRFGVRGGGSRAGFGDQRGAGQSFKLRDGVRAKLNIDCRPIRRGAAQPGAVVKVSARAVESALRGFARPWLHCILVFFPASPPIAHYILHTPSVVVLLPWRYLRQTLDDVDFNLLSLIRERSGFVKTMKPSSTTGQCRLDIMCPSFLACFERRRGKSNCAGRHMRVW